MSNTILSTIKEMLGIPEDHTGFDMDILVGINSSIGILNQLGVGSDDLVVSSSTTWGSLTTEPSLLSMSKNLIYMQTRIIFDPPSNSFIVTAFEKQIEELKWRIIVQVEALRKEESNG